MAAALAVKAASETLVRFFLAMLDNDRRPQLLRELLPRSLIGNLKVLWSWIASRSSTVCGVLHADHPQGLVGARANI